METRKDPTRLEEKFSARQQAILTELGFRPLANSEELFFNDDCDNDRILVAFKAESKVIKFNIYRLDETEDQTFESMPEMRTYLKENKIK